jgi:hypothetical protein
MGSNAIDPGIGRWCDFRDFCDGHHIHWSATLLSDVVERL